MSATNTPSTESVTQVQDLIDQSLIASVEGRCIAAAEIRAQIETIILASFPECQKSGEAGDT
ncbi:hypothetical protein I4U23_004362 [Adineta vaga]|nr:hypothetical protein I4U23_004362 [Adineta vaga]